MFACCCFEVLLLDWREVKRFCFPLAAFYWTDSCFLLTLLLFVLLLDWPAVSRQLDMPFLNADYQHIFPSLSEPGCNVLNLWRCAVNLSVKNPFDALILINVFVHIVGILVLSLETCPISSCFGRPAKALMGYLDSRLLFLSYVTNTFPVRIFSLLQKVCIITWFLSRTHFDGPRGKSWRFQQFVKIKSSCSTNTFLQTHSVAKHGRQLNSCIRN